VSPAVSQGRRRPGDRGRPAPGGRWLLYDYTCAHCRLQVLRAAAAAELRLLGFSLRQPKSTSGCLKPLLQ